MEKSLGYGFEYYMDLIPGMKQADPKASSSIVLAYIGAVSYTHLTLPTN